MTPPAKAPARGHIRAWIAAQRDGGAAHRRAHQRRGHAVVRRRPRVPARRRHRSRDAAQGGSARADRRGRRGARRPRGRVLPHHRDRRAASPTSSASWPLRPACSGSSSARSTTRSISICPATSAASSIRRRGSPSPRAARASRRRSQASRRPSTTTRGCWPISPSPARSASARSSASIRGRSPRSATRCGRPTPSSTGRAAWCGGRRCRRREGRGAGRRPDGRPPGRPQGTGDARSRPLNLCASLPGRRTGSNREGQRPRMGATIIDSRIFGNIFSSEAMRHVWSDENRTAKYVEIERALADRPGPSRHHPAGGRRRDRAQLRHREDRHGEAARADRAHRLPDPRRRLAAQCAVPRQARRVLPLGRDDAGHHRHRDGAADPRGSRARRRRSRGDFRRARPTRARASRHAGRRPQQSAAGDSGDVRLQDGDDPCRRRAASRASRAAAAARAGRRVRRRLRHAGVARNRARWRRRPA